MYDLFKWTGPSQRRNIATAEYEPVQPYVLLALAEQAGCKAFLDVGANIGCYSLFASRIPTVERIIAFEPSPAAYRELSANIALNDIKAETHEKIVSDHHGNIEFGIVSDLAGNSGVSDTAYHQDFSRTVSIESVTLDDFSLEGPLCLKIDVEGHEPSVLAGASRTLSQPCLIQMEGYLDEAGKALEKLGYQRLTTVGPDGYFTNIAGLDALAGYEMAVLSMIKTNHRVKSLTLRKGDFAFSLSGTTADRARGLARKILGDRL